ncbi:hypothetical protein M9458_007863, partial [Cirrhinus mrigala]
MFCQEFSPTMQELKCLLMLKLGATDWHKIRPHFPTTNPRRSQADWQHDDNETYRQAVKTLCQQIKDNFPAKVNATKINCTQKKDESVDDYYVRLYDTFNRYSGMPEPDDRGDVPQMWESHLRSSLMSGLRPEIATIIKQTCIGWEDEKLEKIRQYALHAERLLEEKGGRKGGKELQLTALTMYKGGEDAGVEEEGDKDCLKWIQMFVGFVVNEDIGKFL